MFGESDSESPRVGSPWDSFIAQTPPLKPGNNVEGKVLSTVPKLIPEVEYGNVEYKLKLINPSSERFTRLVTQLKWRLLEGGGQAYYELGVADSGYLIGLSRSDLEASLETLEMMAGEIGASVVIVKEVELPAILSTKGVLNPILGIPISKFTFSGHVDGEYAEASTDNQQTSVNAETIGKESKNDDDEDDMIYSSEGKLPIERFFLTQEFTNSLIDYDIEISTVYKPRPHRSRSRLIAVNTTERQTVSGNNVKAKTGKWTKPKSKKRLRDDDKHESGSSVVNTPIELEPSIASVTSSSMNDVIPKLHALTLDDTPTFASDATHPSQSITPEPRFIVEALIVRKLTLEEAFLDFGGFAQNY
ncbi:hypothetical protein Clacol_001703 [Clathrus columnatus]|uniref:Uncharacterized protein n=1 Tax=Clathrus columnatus TaxID=1419009 RepID=A0AAV4ZYU3_9AGAM|nr:hypothetical protein Clacol_001703 [Clathrus columnatus]